MHSNILSWRIPWTEGAWKATVSGVAKSDITEGLTLGLFLTLQILFTLAVDSSSSACYLLFAHTGDS